MTRQNYPNYIGEKNKVYHYKTTSNGSNIELYQFAVKLPKLGRVDTFTSKDPSTFEPIKPPPGRILSATVDYSDRVFTTTLYFTTVERGSSDTKKAVV